MSVVGIISVEEPVKERVQIINEHQSKLERSVVASFCKNFGILFTTPTAVLLFLATFGRVWEIQTIIAYLP